jgi:hypothetical protein
MDTPVADPLEPLYGLRVAVELIPYPGVTRLRDWLYRHRHLFPRRYQRIGYRWHRLLSLSEIAQIRSMVVKEFPPSAQHFGPMRRTIPSKPSSRKKNTGR